MWTTVESNQANKLHCAASPKKQAQLFLSELRQISIKFDILWHKDGEDNRIK